MSSQWKDVEGLFQRLHVDNECLHDLQMIEGSLEVMEQRWEEAEKRKSQKRRSQKRKSESVERRSRCTKR